MIITRVPVDDFRRLERTQQRFYGRLVSSVPMGNIPSTPRYEQAPPKLRQVALPLFALAFRDFRPLVDEDGSGGIGP